MGKERRRNRRKDHAEPASLTAEKQKHPSVLAVASRKKGNRRVRTKTLNHVNQERA
jgi:hypothetical protein